MPEQATQKYFTAYLTAPGGKRIANLFAERGECAAHRCDNPISFSAVICDECWFKGWEDDNSD